MRLPLLALLLLGGCAYALGGQNHVHGALFSSYGSGGAVGRGPREKFGQACARSVLGLIAFGDASITAAMRDGGISEIAWVDYEVLNVLLVYAHSCTIVHGR